MSCSNRVTLPTAVEFQRPTPVRVQPSGNCQSRAGWNERIIGYKNPAKLRSKLVSGYFISNPRKQTKQNFFFLLSARTMAFHYCHLFTRFVSQWALRDMAPLGHTMHAYYPTTMRAEPQITRPDCQHTLYSVSRLSQMVVDRFGHNLVDRVDV